MLPYALGKTTLDNRSKCMLELEDQRALDQGNTPTYAVCPKP